MGPRTGSPPCVFHALTRIGLAIHRRHAVRLLPKNVGPKNVPQNRQSRQDGDVAHAGTLAERHQLTQPNANIVASCLEPAEQVKG